MLVVEKFSAFGDKLKKSEVLLQLTSFSSVNKVHFSSRSYHSIYIVYTYTGQKLRIVKSFRKPKVIVSRL